jgi:hypothetical protein
MRSESMNIPIKSGVAVIALAVVATSCATVSRKPAESGGVYLVGVAGGG